MKGVEKYLTCAPSKFFFFGEVSLSRRELRKKRTERKMGLEACVICMDSSEYMRNGDYSSSRMDSQEDAVLLLANAKLNSNAESTVAIVSMGNGVDVKLTLTNDEGSVNAAVRRVKVGGESEFANALKVSQLLLKNRQNTHGGQRIVLFIGSPITTDAKTLVRLGKLLRKNGISVDIVSFGEESENAAKLEEFLKAVNKKVDGEDNSHLVTVPAGPHVLSDILLSTPIFAGSFGAGGGGGGVGGGDFGLGSGDPELDAVIQDSIREEQARIAKIQAESAAAAQSEGGGSGDVVMEDQQPSADAAVEGADEEDEDELIRQALEMSIMEASKAGLDLQEEPSNEGEGEGDKEQKGDEDEDMDEADELALAIELSKPIGEAAAGPSDSSNSEPKDDDDIANIMNDPSFLDSVLRDLEGVDPDDPRIQEVLKKGGSDEKKKEDEK